MQDFNSFEFMAYQLFGPISDSVMISGYQRFLEDLLEAEAEGEQGPDMKGWMLAQEAEGQQAKYEKEYNL